ncbi:vitamin K epoxide reductase family protein [Gloeobacter morelensis]|uniref:Thioredoxin n=1 Tax=Gloeobacter morelensis MG652769 TaxID=2781736 RepID=A0ABY3PJK2_9CYAN|nr:vitamin K epoxide reductase family protein [Gloeobacter morelensis]UFP93806.1 thioredoxin [Gloeobacter morelensis MG652769]
MKTVSQQEAAWPRWAIAGLAACGSALTAYLTWTKVSASQAAFCTEGAGCDLVLQSPYASLFGIPVSALGLGLYLTLLLVALLPRVDRWRWGALFGLSLVGVTFSAYLIYLLMFEIVALCLYCVASAALIAAIFALTLVGHRWEKPDNLVLGGLGVVLAGMAGIWGIYNVQSVSAGPLDYSVALAKHLRTTGAKFYGASWCPHCQDQKKAFGEEAERFVPYIECSPGGRGAPPAKVCTEAGIDGYPTWEIGGKRYEGGYPLKDLARLSGFNPAATAGEAKKP